MFSESDWIPHHILIQKVAEIGSLDYDLAKNCVEGINFEMSPNLTLWQFLRALATPGRSEQARNVKELVKNSGILFKTSNN